MGDKPIRVWAVAMPFRKDGAPVIGTFGARIGNVIIMSMEDWKHLCEEVPDLGSRQFEVGTAE